MPRFLIAALGAATLASACKVERTPAEYFDHQQWSAEEVSATAAEIQDRLLALNQAIGRGGVTEAMIALAPDAEARLVTPSHGGLLVGSAEIQSAMQRMVEAGVDVRVSNVSVTVGPQGNTAWFRIEASATPPGAEAALPVSVTGVYVRSEGAWELVQGHVAIPTPATSPRPEASDGGTPEA